MNSRQFRAFLRKLKWSNSRAAAELAVERSTVNRWARGERKIPGPVGVALKTRIELEKCRRSRVS